MNFKIVSWVIIMIRYLYLYKKMLSHINSELMSTETVSRKFIHPDTPEFYNSVKWVTGNLLNESDKFPSHIFRKCTENISVGYEKRILRVDVARRHFMAPFYGVNVRHLQLPRSVVSWRMVCRTSSSKANKPVLLTQSSHNLYNIWTGNDGSVEIQLS